MAETALKFGPEWLRALSQPNPGTNNQINQPVATFVGSPPKYKLADYRYGREEMLALFDRNSKMPDSIKDLTMISSEKCQLPLAFVTMSDDEQRMWARSVNSDNLTRIGKGGGPAPTSAIRGRGGSVDRGRGRGRGSGAFYQRGSSFDDLDGPPGGLTRPRGFDRGDNGTSRPESYWEERERRFDRPFPGRVEENGVVGRKELSRGGGLSDGWRGSSRETEKGREDENGWRSVGRGSEKWNGTTGKSWRSDKDEWERGPLRDGDQLGPVRNGPSSRGSHHSKRSSSQIWDDDTGDQLPEWSREDDCDAEQVGTFDSAGAFMETKEDRIASGLERSSSAENEDIPKEGKVEKEDEIGKVKKINVNTVNDRQEEGRKNSTIRASPPIELNVPTMNNSEVPLKIRTKNTREELQNISHRGVDDGSTPKSDSTIIHHQQLLQGMKPARQLPQQIKQSQHDSASPENSLNRAMMEVSQRQIPVLPQTMMNVKPGIPKQVNMLYNSVQGIPEKKAVPISRSNIVVEKSTDDDNFALLEKAAENMMAKWTAEEEPGTVASLASQNVDKLLVLPIHHEDAYKWFYRDPQSLVQGPFTSQEMLEWFSAGYFTMGLMVRRGCDERFSQLGELIRNWGRVPFAHGTNLQPPLRAQPPVNVPSHQSQNPVIVSTHQPTPTLPPPPLVPSQPPPEQNQQSADQEQQMRLMLLHQQLIQQQLLYKQHFQVQNLLGHLKQDENFSNLSTQQQEQVLLQHLITQQQLQRAAPAGMTNLPSLPDPLAQLQLPLLGLTLPPLISGENTSLWSLPPNASSIPNPPNVSWPLGVPNQPKNPGNSIWDIEVPNQGDLEAQRKASRDRKEKEDNEGRRLKEVEEERKKQAIEEQRRRLAEQEDKRRHEEEFKRKQREEEEEKRRLEEKKRMEEEQRKKEEEMRLLEEKFSAIRRLEEQREKHEEMLRKKMQEDMEKKKREEDILKKKMEEEILQKKKLEELARKEQEERRREEDRKREIERKIRQEIERQNEMERERETERRENERMAHQMDIERQQQEALKKLQEQQKAKSQLPPWLINSEQMDDALSLAQIQQLEQERLVMEREERKKYMQMEQEREIRQAQIVNQQMKNATFSWAQNFKVVEPAPVKTLLEIQQEEADRLAREEMEQPKPTPNALTQSNSGVWNNAASNLSWAASNRDGGWIQSFESHNSASSRGFWDDVVTSIPQTAPISTAKPPKTAKPGSESAFPALAKPAQSSNSGSSNKAKNIRAKKDEATVMKLFETHKLKNSDDFTLWCTKALATMASSVDIPTFIAFLKDVESPYEVHDYVKSYLGEGKDAREFAKQFLERRSKHKNQTKNSSAEENMWGPAPAITPTQPKTQQQVHADFEVNNFTTVGIGANSAISKTKKKKAKKMQKLDMSMLGFTVQADPDRINVGEIDRLDAI